MYTQTCNITKNIAAKLDYYDNMFKLESKATLISYFKANDGRHALILDSTIFHPQGGSQPLDTSIVTVADCDVNFAVQDVRSNGGTAAFSRAFDGCGDAKCGIGAFGTGQRLIFSLMGQHFSDCEAGEQSWMPLWWYPCF